MSSGTYSLSSPCFPKSCPYPPDDNIIALKYIVNIVLTFLYFNPYILLLVSFFSSFVTVEL